MSWKIVRYVLLVVCAAMSTFGSRASAACEEYVCLPDSLSKSYRHTDALKRLMIHRDSAGARRIWQELVAQDSTYSPALYYISRMEESDEALEYARRAYVDDTTNKWYAENYATKLVVSGRYTRAIPVYRRLLHLDSRNLGAYHALAMIYSASGMPYSAISILDSAELRSGYNPYLAEIKHRLLLDTRQYNRALEEGERRTLEMPYDVEARRSLAMTYEVAGRDSLAEVTYLEAFKLDSTDVQTLDMVSRYYYDKGDSQQQFYFERLLFKSPDIGVDEKLHRFDQYTTNTNFYVANYIQLGSIIQQMAIDYPKERRVVDVYARHLISCGEYDQALTLIRANLAHEKTQDVDYINLVQFEYMLERHDLVDTDLKEGLERFPESIELLSFHAFLVHERGDAEGAIAIFRSGLRIATTDEERSVLWGSIGDIYHEMKEDKVAFKAYRRALAYNPDNVLVLNNYAYFLSLEDRELERALEMSKRAIDAEPNNESYVDTYAWILHRLGRNEEAKRYMRQALTLSGQRDASLLCHYADILWALGEKFMAETYWKKAVEVGYDSEEMEMHIQEVKSNADGKER